MRLVTSDYKKVVDVGTAPVWNSLYSTVKLRVSGKLDEESNEILFFLQTGECKKENLSKTLTGMKQVQKILKEVDAKDFVYDYRHLEKKAPWKINEAILSCAELYTTSEGKNLLDETIDLLEYACDNNIEIFVD